MVLLHFISYIPRPSVRATTPRRYGHVSQRPDVASSDGSHRRSDAGSGQAMEHERMHTLLAPTIEDDTPQTTPDDEPEDTDLLIEILEQIGGK